MKFIQLFSSPCFHILLLPGMARDEILCRFFAVRVYFEVFPSFWLFSTVFTLKYFPADSFPFIQVAAAPPARPLVNSLKCIKRTQGRRNTEVKTPPGEKLCPFRSRIFFSSFPAQKNQSNFFLISTAKRCS